jgi:hypothetical protein
MRVIATTDTSREGNDCYIYRSVSLVEQFGLYAVFGFQKVVGWAEYEDVTVLCSGKDLEQAKKVYRDHEGVYEEYDFEDLPL